MRRPAERRGEAVWYGEAADQAVPHSCVVDKYWEGHLRSEGSQPQARPHIYIPGLQCQGYKSP